MDIESYKGNIYEGFSNWRFIVIKESPIYGHVEIKLLNRPNFISSCDVIKGHAVIGPESFKNCKIISSNDIMEYIKIRLIYY